MKWLSFLTICVLLFSCKKETIELETHKIELGVDYKVRDLVFFNDTLAFACGGDIWEGGFIAKSTDGGENWNIIYDHNNIVFKIAFLDEQRIAAGCFWGGLLTSLDYGDTWQFAGHPEYNGINDLRFLNDSTLIFATGDSYHFGGTVLYNFNSGAFTFNKEDKAFNSLHFFDEDHGVFGAYGLIYKTRDGGETLEATNASSDFYVDLAFNNTGKGIAVGYQGKILTTNNQGNTWQKTAAKSNFFTSKGNLETVSINQNEGFIGGQNGVFFYANDFAGDWLKIEHPFEAYDILNITLKNNSTGFAMGSDGLLFKFYY